jgi:neurotransmitter:Na+ symporter, NSS family
MILVVAARALSLPGAMEGVAYLFTLDPKALGNSNIWLMATGQAFFSLSLGSGAAITYGAYVNKSTNILKAGAITGITTIVVALLMGLAIFPAVFAMGHSPDGGPGLLFITLPLVFKQIKGGSIFAIFFFASTFFAAFTSALAMIEPSLRRISNVTGWSRGKTSLLAFVILAVLGIPMSLSFGPLAEVKLFDRTLFDNIDFLIDKILMPFNALVALVLAGWLWKGKGIMKELSNEGSLKLPLHSVIYWLIRVVAPLLILVAVLKPVYDNLFARIAG